MSDWYQIESNLLTVQVTSRGAELKRLYSKIWNRELMWAGNESVWGRTAPILFPIVGKLIDDEYILNSKKYKMHRHGFARDLEFECVNCTDNEVTFRLVANKNTLMIYPYNFSLDVTYQVIENALMVNYSVKNLDQTTMFYSIGAHPAFDLTDFKDYELHFEKNENQYYKLNNGLVDFNKTFSASQTFNIEPNLFYEDALIYKALKSNFIELKNKSTQETLKISFKNLPYMGLWSTTHCHFICVEPWWGLADTMNHNKDFSTKPGIMKLEAQMQNNFSFKIEIFKPGK